MIDPAISLSAIRHRHGEWRTLEDLVDRGLATEQEITTLSGGGLTRYSVIEFPVRELFAECAGDSLTAVGVDPAIVDAVVFFSSTFSSYDDHDDLIDLCWTMGLIHALPIGLFEAQCSNFSYALMVATSLIHGQGMRTVLLLGADSLDESRARRLLPAAGSVFSDTVVSCVVSTEIDSGYAIESVGHVVDPMLATLDPEKDIIKFIDLFATRLAQLCAETYARTDLHSEDFSHLVLANLIVPVLRNYAAVAGISFSRVPTENIARFGHCFAHDQLITLATLDKTGAMTQGQRALAIGIGANHLFSSTVLRKL